GSPSSSGTMRACERPASTDARSRRSTSANSAGSSNAAAPCRIRCWRRRSRTRPCTSAITVSTETSAAKIVADARAHLDVAARRGDDAALLLQAEHDAVGAALLERVIGGEAPANRAGAFLVGVAVL